MSGRHTRDRINTVTVFKDHASNFGYSHLQPSASQDDTLEAKAAFVRVAKSFHVTIEKYRADNGRFAEAAFKGKYSRVQPNHFLLWCG